MTTFQVARVLGVSLPTVVNYVNKGLLKAHRTVGGHRRITRLDLIEFCHRERHPLPSELSGSITGTGRILVVDDDRDFAGTIKDYLTIRGGFEVCLAYSGFDAGLSVAQFKPDLIIMDLMMDGLDGFDAYLKLRETPENNHIYVLACTALPDQAMAKRVSEAGFHGQVDKSKTLDALLEQVRQYLPSGPVAPIA